MRRMRALALVLLAGDAEAAGRALARSEALGKEPADERARLAAAGRLRWPRRGLLEVFSEPAGALVYLDDEFLGRTDPASGRLVKGALAPGRHRLRLSLADHAELVQELEVRGDSLSRFRGALSREESRRRWPLLAIGRGSARRVASGGLGPGPPPPRPGRAEPRGTNEHPGAHAPVAPHAARPTRRAPGHKPRRRRRGSNARPIPGTTSPCPSGNTCC